MKITGIGAPPAHAATPHRQTPASNTAGDTASQNPADVAARGRTAEAPAHVARALLAENTVLASSDVTNNAEEPGFFGHLVSLLARKESTEGLFATALDTNTEQPEPPKTEEDPVL